MINKHLRLAVFMLICAALGVSAASLWLLPGEAERAGLFLPENAEYVLLGKQIYRGSCASCHGVNLEGQVPDWQSPGADGKLPAPPHDETGHTWHHADRVLFDITKLGVAKAANLKNYESSMPAYEGVLSDDEIVAVLSYIKSSWPEEMRNRHDELNKQFQERD